MVNFSYQTKGNQMTYADVINKMNNKTFYSDSFGGEMVTVKGVQVIGESGLLNVINSKQDVRDLYNDYKKA